MSEKKDVFTVEDAPASEFTVGNAHPSETEQIAGGLPGVPRFVAPMETIKAPGYRFGQDVATGMGFDANKIKQAEDTEGKFAGAREAGKQAASGLSRFVGRIAHDPFHAMEPIHGMASNLERGIQEKSPGQILGASANILGGAEGTERGVSGAGRFAGKLPERAATAFRTEKGALRPGLRSAGMLAGAELGHLTGVPFGELGGALIGRSILDAIVPGRAVDPLPVAIREGRAARLPVRVPRSAIPKGNPTPFAATNTPTGEFAGRTPAQVELNAPVELESHTPLIGSEAEWKAFDQRNKILQREASAAGRFHAARGSTKSKIGLQERIRKSYEE